MSAEIETRRIRLAVVERELSQLVTRHDLAISAFRFGEARDLQQRIAVLERERVDLVAVLPAAAPSPLEPPIPVRVRSRRRLPGSLPRPHPPRGA